MINWQEWSTTLSQIRLPAVIIDLEAFDRNIKRVAEILQKSGSTAHVRVATKSIRVPSLISRVLAHGLPFKGLMAYSVEEVSFLADQGFDDFLVAYPTIQESDCILLRQLHDRGIQVRLVVDHLDHLEKLNQFFFGTKNPFEVVIEMDASLRIFGGKVHIGGRRSPVRDTSALLKLLSELKERRNLKFAGLMIYEGQVAGIGDFNPANFWINPFIRLMKRVSLRRLAHLKDDVTTAFAVQGIPLILFNGGGTGSLLESARAKHLTEVTVGSGFLNPHLFDYYDHLNFEPAAFFALQVNRQSDPDWVTCSGGGYVASGRPGWDKAPAPVYPPGAKLNSDEGAGEVQTPLGVSGALPLGSVAIFRHAKGGELAERFQEYHFISENKIVERAKTYRGFGQCFF